MSRQFLTNADQIVVAGFPNLLALANALTYAAQINPTGYGAPSAGRIVSMVNSATGKGHAFYLQSTGGGQIVAQVSKTGSDAQAVAAFPSSLLNNEWKYVAMEYAIGGPGPRIFLGTHAAKMVELAYVSQTDGAGSLIDVTGFPFLIGNSGLAGGNAFQGRIGDVTPWNGALALASLDKLRLFPAAIVHKFSEAALQAHWGLGDVEKTATLRDLSGNNFAAVASGTKVDHNPGRETMGSSGW